MHNKLIIFLILFSANIFCPAFINGQNTQPASSARDTTKKGEQLIVKNADNFLRELENGKDIQYLRGNVRVAQDSTFMYCDSARIIENQLVATGNVVIIQNDSIQVFSDSLFYDGDIRIAHLSYGVVLQNDNRRLFTESLDYDLNTRLASFQDTALLQRGNMKLSSISGIYNMKTKQAFFEDEVVIIDEEFKLNTDSLRYSLKEDIAYFIGPTYILQNGRKIYCEDGFYNAEKGSATFGKNAIITDDETELKALRIHYVKEDSLLILTGNAVISDSSAVIRGDQIRIYEKTDEIHITGDGSYISEERTIKGPDIRYNNTTEDVFLTGRSSIETQSSIIEADTISYLGVPDLGEAHGNVVWRDTAENRLLLSDRVFFRDSSQFYKAIRWNLRPVFIQEVDGDSFFLAADTLVRGLLADSLQYMIADGSVRMLKTDFSGICDSLYYSDIDSTFSMFRNPVCWSDTTQFTGDTIHMVVRNESLEEIRAQKNGFILSRISENYYNQVHASEIRAHLVESELRHMEARHNATSIYMIQDDEKAFVGPNRTLCSTIHFYFESDSLQRINFEGQSDSKLTPIQQAGNADLYLEGFEWHIDNKPVSSEEIRWVKTLVPSQKKNQGEEQLDRVEDPFEDDVRDVLDKEKDTLRDDNLIRKKKER